MSKRLFKPRASQSSLGLTTVSQPTLATRAYLPGIHTFELPELFSRLRARASFPLASETRANMEWNGNMSYADSLDAAEFGKWDAPKIKTLTLPEINGESQDVTFSYDVTGHHLDMAAYISGEPEYWQVEEPVSKPCGRVIRLAIEIGGHALVDALQMANRGQAIIALVNSLELQGHSIELTIVRSYESDNENYTFLIPVKHAGQALDIKRLQFIIGHPSFYRRLLFGLAEIAHGVSLDTRSTSTRHHAPNGFIHVNSNSGLADTLEESLQWAHNFAHSSMFTGN